VEITEVSELDSDPLIRYAQIRDSPWLFLKHCVYTHDEIDADNPIKRFPHHLRYLQFLTLMWLKNKKLAIPKSRRMTASWTFISLSLWDCLFHKGRSWALCSKKEEDSKELIQRAKFIYDHIPEEILSKNLLPKLKRGEMQSSPPVMDFEEIYSKLQGFPAGANQLRQRGFSGILQDECCFWENAEDAYASAKPTIDGGGRMVMISSRSIEDGGFFKKIVFDRLDAPDIRFAEVPPVPVKSPMTGVEVWQNPKNKFCIIDLHYTANELKRGDEFKQALKDELPIRKFLMEYERSWSTFEGKKVYEDFNERIHLTRDKPKMHVGLPLLAGWDSSGLTPAFVCGQLQEGRLVIFREHMGMGKGAHRFVPEVAELLKFHYQNITSIEEQVISWFDPAAFKKNEITEETYLQAMIKGGFKQIRPGAMTWNRRVESVADLLVGLVHGETKIVIYEEDCPVLVAGLKGGFRYPDSVSDIEPDKLRPIKDIHSHPNDALQYLCSGLKDYRNSNYNIPDIKIPSYGFQKKQQDITPKTRKIYGNDR